MAPPAKPSITGRKVEEAEPKPKPNRMPITSSRAMKMEIKKVRTAVTPASIKGATQCLRPHPRGVRGKAEGADRGDEGRDCGSAAADGFG